MKRIVFVNRIILSLFFLLLGLTSVQAQQKLKFSVASFELDQFDMTAKNEQYKKIDGNGDLFSIIKVTSNNPEDDLKAYHFSFGNMNHEVVQKDGELWVYVQRNAKMVTISRQGYTTINKYDLQTTIEAGRTYTMQLSSQGAVIKMQMVLFKVKPADSKAMITIKGTATGDAETPIGITDNEGLLAKGLTQGTYTYKALAEGYYPSEGSFTLNDQSQRHEETIALRPMYSLITLNVPSDADIYVNGELKGRRTWTGKLNAGNYQVECRQANHRPSMQSITVEENQPKTFALSAPIPITGSLSVLSQPLNATIYIDGKEQGTSPAILNNLLIGTHSISLKKNGYNDLTQTVTVKENEMTEVSLTMNNVPVFTDEKTFTVTGNGKTVTFKMKKVIAGTFEMGNYNDGTKVSNAHSVTLTKSYYMGETEVTQALWYAVMGESPTSDGSKWNSSYGLGDNYPAYYISYEDCEKFLVKLNQLSGQKFRFPTEAEWEFAAKGGKKSKGYTYAGSNAIDDVAWYTVNSYDLGSSNANYGTHVVKTKAANELGLYDMSGNVWEWCYDWYGSYSSSAQTNPTGATTGSNRVCRGGSWNGNATLCHTAIRSCISPSTRSNALGFRLAL